MISLKNMDSSFFQVIPPEDAFQPMDWMTKKVISFSIKEQMYGMMSGTLSLMDDDMHALAFALRPGRMLDISWGYSRTDLTGESTVVALSKNPGQMINPAGAFVARRARAVVRGAIGGSCDDKGNVVYNCPFVAFGLLPIDMQMSINYSFPGCLKSTVVMGEMTMLGISQMFIRFRRGFEPYSGIRDNMSSFGYLVQCAREWRAMFRIGFNAAGIPIGLFCDFDDDVMIQSFLTSTTGAFGNSGLFEWKQGIANVKSYTWGLNSAEGGGDSVRIIYQNGMPIFVRTVATPESVVVYKLDAGMVAAQFSGLSLADQFKKLQELMTISTMDELIQRKFFVPYTETTAPQGMGFEINIETVGNPLYTPPARVMFGAGFPDVLKSRLVFYMTEVEHKIDNKGYTNSIKVVDTFSLTGGTMIG